MPSEWHGIRRRIGHVNRIQPMCIIITILGLRGNRDARSIRDGVRYSAPAIRSGAEAHRACWPQPMEALLLVRIITRSAILAP